MPSIAPIASTGLTITNPLVLYRALLATKRIDPDPSQHRLALHLQKLYHRLKDYEPTVEYRARLQQINRAVGGPTASTLPENDTQPVTSSPPRSARNGILASLLAQKSTGSKRATLALTQVLTSQEEALRLDSPRGLLLYGEVGTGKSMLVDLLADCLPNKKKKRWHFNTFMLDTFSRLEHLRRRRGQLRSHLSPTASGSVEDEYSLLVLARDMISTSPILFLDEFQLPDRAASKILLNLLTAFFQLGGVLVATSNRMPEELAKASGVEFAPPPATPAGVFGWPLRTSWTGRRREQDPSLSGGRREFAGFLEVLKARCEVWDMGGGKDWRRREAETRSSSVISSEDAHEPITLTDTSDSSTEQSRHDSGIHLDDLPPPTPETTSSTPKNYFLQPPSPLSSTPPDNETIIRTTLSLPSLPYPIPWTPTQLNIYSRPLILTHTHAGIVLSPFSALCATNLGPADYITLASTFHTLILTDLPVLTSLHKNEARRLITLLDALYEARCKLLILHAAAGPDDLFFPEPKSRAPTTNSDRTVAVTSPSPSPPPSQEPSGAAAAGDGAGQAAGEGEGAGEAAERAEKDAIYAETFAEIHQDVNAPFRPNISAYDEPSGAAKREGAPAWPTNTSASSAAWRSVLADEDSDFGPTHPLSLQQPQPQPGAGNEIGRQLDFSHAAAYTGEDERFAYKRAASRLWEMCGERWWARGGAGDEDGDGNGDGNGDGAGATGVGIGKVEEWWRPLSLETRRWEGTGKGKGVGSVAGTETETVIGVGAARDGQAEGLFRHGASPFRVSEEPPPRIWGGVHAWGMMRWGKKAGRWGRGVEALAEDRVVDEGEEGEIRKGRRGGGKGREEGGGGRRREGPS